MFNLLIDHFSNYVASQHFDATNTAARCEHCIDRYSKLRQKEMDK